jgi:hypothetical protein
MCSNGSLRAGKRAAAVMNLIHSAASTVITRIGVLQTFSSDCSLNRPPHWQICLRAERPAVAIPN